MKPKTTRSSTPKRPSLKAAFALWISFSFVGWLLIMGLASLLFPADSRNFAIEEPAHFDIAPAHGPE